MIPGNTGNLSRKAQIAIAQLMSKGISMRKAKRMLGITKKEPIIKLIKQKMK